MNQLALSSVSLSTFKSQFAEIGREGVLVFLSCCFVFHELNFHGVIRTVRWGIIFLGHEAGLTNYGANWHPHFAQTQLSGPLHKAHSVSFFDFPYDLKI